MFAGFFFFAINVHGNTSYSKNSIPDQIDGIYTLFQTQMTKSIPYFRLEMLARNERNGKATLVLAHSSNPPSRCETA